MHVTHEHEKMTRDNEISAIFNPRRVRAPSVVVTGDSPNGSFADGGFTNVLHSSNPQISRSNSISHPDNLDYAAACNSTAATNAIHPAAASQSAAPAAVATTPSATAAPASVAAAAATATAAPKQITIEQPTRKLTKLKESCCSDSAKKMYFGVCVTILITASWVGATHCIKFLYIRQNISMQHAAAAPSLVSANDNFFFGTFENDTNDFFEPVHIAHGRSTKSPAAGQPFNAPFFTAWFCTNFALLFFPIYLFGRLTVSNCSESPGEILANIVRGFRDRGFTATRFLHRCLMFSILWLMTSYLYILSLRALFATDVITLFATNVACAYLLSWVILHEQFVGIRVSEPQIGLFFFV